MRKTVSVIFADLVSSTALGERLDPEATRTVMEQFFDHMRAALERHGGTVQKYIGDAVVAFFGVPTMQEDDALRAVRAAVDMRAALDELNADLESVYNVALSVRIGINSGEVVVDDSTLGGSLAVGDAVNVAARLQSAADPGDILLGEQTHRLVKDAVRVETMEELALKGKSQPVRAVRLLQLFEGTAAMARRFDTPLVGRRPELERLRRIFTEVVTERTCVICTVVAGPGTGKTRLAIEFVRSLGGEAQVLSGRCLSYGEGTTFRPLVEMLGELPLERGVEEIFVTVRERFEAMARKQPLVLVFDDLHWAEPTLLDLIDHVATWSSDAPILCLCLARPGFEPPWEGRRLHLHPLGADEARELLDELAGDLHPQQRAQILERAEGNPLFLEQTLAALAEDGEVEVPLTIQVLISGRLDRLPDDELRLVQRAAVVGRSFSRAALVALSPADTAVSAIIQRLMRKELVETSTSPSGDKEGFRFKHALIRDGAFGSLAKRDRAQLHGRLAHWLADQGEEDVIVGYHFEQAFRYGAEIGLRSQSGQELAREAARRLGAAGRRSLDQGDLPTANNLLQRSFQLLPRGDPDPARVSISLTSALIACGELARARDVLEKTIDNHPEDGNLVLHARLELALLCTHIGPASDMEDLRRIAEEAIPVFESSNDEYGLASAWAALGEFHHNAVRVGARHEAYEHALRHAQRAPDRRLEKQIVMQITLGLDWGPMPVAEAIAYCTNLLADNEGDLQVEASCKVALGVLNAMRREFAQARELITRAREIWAKLGDSRGLLRAAESRRLVEMYAGDPRAAETEVRGALETLERMGEKTWLSSRAGFLAEALAAQGRYDEAEHYASVCREAALDDDVEAQALWRQVQARVLAARGDFEGARSLALAAVARAELTDALAWHASLLMNAGEILCMAGNTAGAAPVARRALNLFSRKGDLVGAGRAAELLDRIESPAPQVQG